MLVTLVPAYGGGIIRDPRRDPECGRIEGAWEDAPRPVGRDVFAPLTIGGDSTPLLANPCGGDC